jgi:hypothetical protein
VPEVCKLEAQISRQKKGIIPYYTFGFELSAKIAAGSTPDSGNRSRKN